MKKIIYYVAASLDGYISGPNNDISNFIMKGPGIDKYLKDLKKFNTVMMGRKTYEFGYAFGLEPGQPAYPHMEHYIFSNTLHLDHTAESVHVEKINLNKVKEIRENSKTDIYLCGGGTFAGWLLDNNMIDQIKVKLNPITLGSGTKLFGNSISRTKWKLCHSENYEGGIQISTFENLKIAK